MRSGRLTGCRVGGGRGGGDVTVGERREERILKKILDVEEDNKLLNLQVSKQMMQY